MHSTPTGLRGHAGLFYCMLMQLLCVELAARSFPCNPGHCVVQSRHILVWFLLTVLCAVVHTNLLLACNPDGW